MSTLKRINKHTVMAQLRRGQSWSGYVVGNNVIAYHIRGGWYMGYPVTVSTIEELNTCIQAYEINSSTEYCRYAVLWE